MSDTPRVDEFCKTAGGQYTYDLSGLARHLERELAAAIEDIATLREFAKHLLVVHEHTEPLVASYIVDEVLRKCGK